jgi:hypothetical protein
VTVLPNPATRTSQVVKWLFCISPLVSRLFCIRLFPLGTCKNEAAVRQRTDCTSTNGLVAPRRVRTQIRTAQPGSIRSTGSGTIAATQG